MKKLMENMAAKTVAVILSFVFAVISVLSVLGAFYAAENEMYVKSEQEVKNGIFESKLVKYYSRIISLYENGSSAEEINDYCDKSDIYYTLTDKNGQVLMSNFSGGKYIAKYDHTAIYDHNSEEFEEEFEEDYDKEKYNYNISVSVYASENFDISQSTLFLLKISQIVYKLKYSIYAIGAFGIIGYILLFCFLCASAGRGENGSIKLNFFDKIPFDLILLLNFMLSMFLLYLTEMNYGLIYYVHYAFFFFSTVILYFAFFISFLSFVTRIKAKTLLKNTVIYFFLAFVFKYIKKFFGSLFYILKNLSIVKKTVLAAAATVLIIFFSAIVSLGIFNSIGFLVFVMLMIIALMLFAAIYFSICLKNIKIGGKLMAQGNFDIKINSERMPGEFKEFCDYLNNINYTVQNAVNEKMKSEHLKTELITNVSHDIKTPLTSIINYVDLIKKENTDNEKIKEYTSVLDRQSKRLKKLIVDLVEASKASTGNIKVEFSECEVGVLLNQTLGEFSEKFKEAGLTPVLKIPEKPVKIMADGRYLWRVFENLTSNICKYSLKNTRVYLEVIEEDKIYITFKNISAQKLDIPESELTERFVRGDSSRNTEGSGLGLSIAKSLTELQNGKLTVKTDGDLFKAILEFERKE